jgi:hypothetical protein
MIFYHTALIYFVRYKSKDEQSKSLDTIACFVVMGFSIRFTIPF